jgi:hypothetical protein
MGSENATTQKTVIHAAAWTASKNMTAQDFANFKQETAALVGKVAGLRRAWVGKLRAPVTVEGVQRDHAIVLEFDDVKAKEAYSSKHPSPWYEDFNKLRDPPGSTSFDLVGE